MSNASSAIVLERARTLSAMRFETMTVDVIGPFKSRREGVMGHGYRYIELSCRTSLLISKPKFGIEALYEGSNGMPSSC